MKNISIIFSFILGLACPSCNPLNLQQLGPIIGSSQGSPSSIPNLNNRQFTPPKPELKKLANGHYTVLEDWPVNVSGRKFIVQKGYTSNGITAPQSIKSVLGDDINAPETWTAVFHDWCFTQKDLTRLQCDNFYIQLMRDFKINPQKIQLMGATVKGYSIYKGN